MQKFRADGGCAAAAADAAAAVIYERYLCFVGFLTMTSFAMLGWAASTHLCFGFSFRILTPCSEQVLGLFGPDALLSWVSAVLWLLRGSNVLEWAGLWASTHWPFLL